MKRLVVCCDGTWNAADSAGAETNVFRLAKSVHAHHGETATQQIVLYLRGIGTTGLKLGDILQGATGFGTDENIRSAYMFLAQNYESGDEIFLFGFSRGAFTARSLSGFIHIAGLLKRETLDAIHQAWAIYRQRGVPTAQVPAIAPADVHADVEIKFLGVWDTVGSLGIPGSRFAEIDARQFGFHDTGVCPIVRHGCHALAIDEHRDAFVPTLWTGELPSNARIDQTWFAGVHSDVGGGYPERSLADIPLDWMATHAEADGLEIDRSSLLPAGASPNALAPMHESRTGVFMVDRLRPTWREVCQREFPVLIYERLYEPMDDNKNRLITINEKIHASVAARFNKRVLDLPDADTGTIYAPKNIDIFADQHRVLKPDTPIDDFAWPSPTTKPASQATT